MNLRALLVEVLRNRIVCNPTLAIPGIISVTFYWQYLFLHTCRICSPGTSMTPAGSCFGRSQCCETSCNIWRSLKLLKSLPRVTIRLSKAFTWILSGSRMKLVYSIFITVIIDDPIYCEKHSNWFHSRHCLKVSTFLIHHAPGAPVVTWNGQKRGL